MKTENRAQIDWLADHIRDCLTEIYRLDPDEPNEDATEVILGLADEIDELLAPVFYRYRIQQSLLVTHSKFIN